MSDKDKNITREELYREVWLTPMSKLAGTWGVPISSIVKACTDMNVPRPGSGHWQLVKLGWKVERDPLPVTGATTAVMAVIKQRRSGQVHNLPSTSRQLDKRWQNQL